MNTDGVRFLSMCIAAACSPTTNATKSYPRTRRRSGHHLLAARGEGLKDLESMLTRELADRFAYNGRAALAGTDSLALNASAATESPMLKLLTTIERFGLPASRYTDKLRDAQCSDWRADASECYEALKFTPQRTLLDGLKEMIE